jgi:hypothetical protein
MPLSRPSNILRYAGSAALTPALSRTREREIREERAGASGQRGREVTGSCHLRPTARLLD